ncbi:MAG TPA: glycosyltransferase [Dehalococcoidia bacterium]|nr:glycosyltransferase [Dehalococcoidia bacterium]
MPKVSVIIPTYNQAQFLGEAVRSALAQTYRDFEIIVIDDGSTDNTAEVVRSFLPAVIYFRQENQGLSAARNKGTELASGEYLIFLDSDDILLEDALEKCVSFLDQHPEAGCCFGQFYTIDEDGRPLRLRRPRGIIDTFVRDGKEEIAHFIFPDYHDETHTSAALVRSSCFEEIGLFDTTLRMSGDLALWIRLAKKFDVGHLAEPLAKVRFHFQSMTAIKGADVVQSAHAAILESVFEDEELGPLYSHLRKKVYFKEYCILSRVSVRTGHQGTGLRYLLKALKTHPGALWEMRGLSLLMDTAKDFLPARLRGVIVKKLVTLRLR